MKLEFPQPTVLLEKTSTPKVMVIMGVEGNHIQFLSRRFKRNHPKGEIVRGAVPDDTELLSQKSPTLWVVDDAQSLGSIADATWAKIPAFSAVPLEKRSVGINAIVKYANRMIGGEKLDKETLNRVGDKLIGERSAGDLDNLIVDAMDLLLTPLPDKVVKLEDRCEPWVDPLKWIVPGESLYYRLLRLHKLCVGYVFARLDDWANGKKLGVSPAQFAWLKTLKLNDRLVNETICHLSRWKNRQLDSERCAFLVSVVWS